MASSPVVEWRGNLTPFAVITSQTMTGTGFSGAIPAGTTSSQVTVRLYNNFAAASSIADAINCSLAVYDDAINQAIGTKPSTTGLYVQVECTTYNTSTTSADTQFFAIGGQVKHPIPLNSATISGTGANYVTIILQIVVPSNATQGAVSQGIWVEYSSTS